MSATTTYSTRRDLPAGRPEWGTAAWHNALQAGRHVDRTEAADRRSLASYAEREAARTARAERRQSR